MAPRATRASRLRGVSCVNSSKPLATRPRRSSHARLRPQPIDAPAHVLAAEAGAALMERGPMRPG
jgi:hypothetical protein